MKRGLVCLCLVRMKPDTGALSEENSRLFPVSQPYSVPDTFLRVPPETTTDHLRRDTGQRAGHRNEVIPVIEPGKADFALQSLVGQYFIFLPEFRMRYRGMLIQRDADLGRYLRKRFVQKFSEFLSKNGSSFHQFHVGQFAETVLARNKGKCPSVVPFHSDLPDIVNELNSASRSGRNGSPRIFHMIQLNSGTGRIGFFHSLCSPAHYCGILRTFLRIEVMAGNLMQKKQSGLTGCPPLFPY